ncbi:urease accessory protein UreD [Tropicibacter naphthalenivorans]|uniref:urease accessory protein UreD n=1 Tax=Tropicibacter naphthalenivorans TaxID=441103 RepID=UPI001F4151D0|nr:urease accessory protein UreD [Tropicibacter naphthalenivorans]
MTQPRAQGALDLAVKQRGARSAIDRLRSQGAMKTLFPRSRDMVQAIMINTSGGLTGGDHLTVDARAGAGAGLSLTTQAAERAYRSASGFARMESTLTVEAGASLFWLPQELILFEGAALRRRLTCDLAADARLLLVEPVVFGRAAMGETLRDVQFDDHIAVRREGVPLYHDAVRLTGDVMAGLQRAAIAGGAGAMASLVYVAPDAEAFMPKLRALMPETGGASLMGPDILLARLVAADSYEMRRHLVPMLDALSQDTLPTSWRL